MDEHTPEKSTSAPPATLRPVARNNPEAAAAPAGTELFIGADIDGRDPVDPNRGQQ